MKKFAMIGLTAMAFTGFTAPPAIAQSVDTSARVCGSYDFTDRIGRRWAGRACFNNVTYLNYGNGEGAKVTVIRSNSSNPGRARFVCTMRDGSTFRDRNAGRTIAGPGSRFDCTASAAGSSADFEMRVVK